jgi:hypothetical protein
LSRLSSSIPKLKPQIPWAAQPQPEFTDYADDTDYFGANFGFS